MARPFSLPGRNLEILSAIVKSYIATGEPVGSKYVSDKRKDRLSPASIRNVMAELEEHGYLSHPHTSAGRVPTGKAFREYVQHLSTPRLNPNDAGFIQDNLEQATTLEERLGRSSHVLAALTRQMGVAVVAPLSQSVLERVQFTRLGDHRILVVLVARGDLVRHRIIRVAEEIRPEELDRLANYVNHEFAGWPLAAVRGEIRQRIRVERAEFDAILSRLRLLCAQGFLNADTDAQICLEGAPNLVVGVEILDGGRVRQLLQALEDKEKLIQLLDECIRGDMAVRIGLGETYPGMRDYALIGAVCELEPGVPGRIAVIGPMRMPYERAISAVAHVAKLFRHLSDVN